MTEFENVFNKAELRTEYERMERDITTVDEWNEKIDRLKKYDPDNLLDEIIKENNLFYKGEM